MLANCCYMRAECHGCIQGDSQVLDLPGPGYKLAEEGDRDSVMLKDPDCSVIRWRIYSWAIPWRRNSTLKGYEFSLLSWKKRKSRIFLVVQRDGPPTNTIDFSRIRNPFTHACIKVRGLRLYCKNLSTTVSSSLHLFKIKPIIDQLNGKFSELYNILPENVALDESCMWKGWLNINQFI
uniref:Uncharacterized protein n=2 Tax=Bombyx mori TaxID=7091 RepID=A0A8R2QWN5_BOMMO|nr:uncharacterized protein LOC110386600 isoform X2 [Bombyx mori]